jgi:hypothetical protein
MEEVFLHEEYKSCFRRNDENIVKRMKEKKHGAMTEKNLLKS